MRLAVQQTEEFKEWFKGQQAKIQSQVEARVNRALEHEHFGDAKDLGKGLAEFRFKSGLKIYFTVRKQGYKTVILILGGVKNGQKKDIKKARGILTRLL